MAHAAARPTGGDLPTEVPLGMCAVRHGSTAASTRELQSLQSRGRETRVSVSVTSRYHFIVVDEPGSEKPEPDAQSGPLLPQPSPLFWRQAWIKFQRALDPLALPKPLPQLPWDKARMSDGSHTRRASSKCNGLPNPHE